MSSGSEHLSSEDERLLDLLFAEFAEAPPASLRDRVLARAAAPSVDRGLDPVEGLRRAVATLDDVVADLGPDDWDRPTVEGLDVRELLGHITGSDRYLGGQFGLWEAVDPSVDQTDHIGTTRSAIERTHGSAPADIVDDWRGGAARLLAGLDAAPSGLRSAPVAYHSIAGDGHLVLTARSFELWTHTEDICRATGRSLCPPDPERIAAMTAVAAALVEPGAVVANDGRPVVGSLRLVLTGAGGGTWDLQLGALPSGDAPSPAPSSVIVADAVAFCRLIGNRGADQLRAEIDGDADLARLVLTGISRFALD